MSEALTSCEASVDLGGLGLDQGGDILLKRAVRLLAPNSTLSVHGTHEELPLHLRAWARVAGHRFEPGKGETARIIVGGAEAGRWANAEHAGEAYPKTQEGVLDEPPATWGLAARGARVEDGGPDFLFGLDKKIEIWTDEAPRLYARALAAQWDPAAAVDWDAPMTHPEEVEDAVVQVMTYLVENETAALLVPARFLAQIHPHFREIMQLLAVQAADEARHIEVFTRRAALRRPQLGLSTVGGQASLKTLIDEPDFALAMFLLSVMGEGTFLVLLDFLNRHGPDPVTRQITRLAGQDEARHVAFGLAHLQRHIERDPAQLSRLADAIHRRHDALAETAGLNEEVFEALVILAAGGFSPEEIKSGHHRVLQLTYDMDEARKRNLIRLGFDKKTAADLSALHTKNFM